MNLKIAGPYGERDDQQVLVQKVVPETDQVFVRLASNGKRLVSKLLKSSESLNKVNMLKVINQSI